MQTSEFTIMKVFYHSHSCHYMGCFPTLFNMQHVPFLLTYYVFFSAAGSLSGATKQKLCSSSEVRFSYLNTGVWHCLRHLGLACPACSCWLRECRCSLRSVQGLSQQHVLCISGVIKALAWVSDSVLHGSLVSGLAVEFKELLIWF